MVWLGEISYEIFLVHLVVMEIAMVEVLHWPVYTGSAPALFVVTLAADASRWPGCCTGSPGCGPRVRRPPPDSAAGRLRWH